MTETREVPKYAYEEIREQALDLFNFIHSQMTALHPEGSEAPLTAEWHQLHEWMTLASILHSQASRAEDDAPDTGSPVPYWPAGITSTPPMNHSHPEAGL
jgi:hypothetical protein